MGLPCKVLMGTPRVCRQLLPHKTASGRRCERKHVPVKKHRLWRRQATLERPPVRRDSSDPPRNVPRRLSEHGCRAWRRRSGVLIAQRCMTACTAQASFSGEPRQQQGRRRDGQPTPAAPSHSWVISASQACSRVASVATFSRLVPAVRCA